MQNTHIQIIEHYLLGCIGSAENSKGSGAPFVGVGGAAVDGGAGEGDEVAGAGDDEGGGAAFVGVGPEVVAEGGGPY